MIDIYKELSECGVVETDKSFKSMTTFRIGGNAKYVIYPDNIFHLQVAINKLKKYNIPYKVFGNGSNILCSDDEYDGCIIKLTRSLNDFHIDGESIIVQSGASIISLAYKAMENELSGLEFASGIPGTVGGCVFMNAGAYKSNMSDIVTEVQVLAEDEVKWINNADCDFSYRHSIFSNHPDWIILAVKMELKKGNKEEIKNLMTSRQKRRYDSQPLDKPSAGSTFRNVGDQFAWKLIDEIGYRGKRIGDAAVSEKHSNFIVNLGDAKAEDVIKLTDEIKEKVYENFNVEMIMEVEKFNWKKSI